MSSRSAWRSPLRLGEGPAQLFVSGGTAETVTFPFEFTPAPAPAQPIAIVPATGTLAGGTHVVVEVVDSTGLVGISLGGVPVTSFAIDDATHVSRDTGAHAAGVTNVNTLDAYGLSTPLVGGYTFT